LGHSSISVTVNLYGHLVAGANIAWVDRLDEKPSSGKDPQTRHKRPMDTRAWKMGIWLKQ